MSRRRLVVLVAAAVTAVATAACAPAPPVSSAPDEMPAAWQLPGDDEAAPEAAPRGAAGPSTPASTRPEVGADASLIPDARPTREAPTQIETLGQELPPAPGVPQPIPSVTPVRLRIPAIGVDGAAVVSVGVEDGGAMEVPPPDQVGWYRFGPTPGTQGSAVLAAHIAAAGVDGVFRHLERLEAGDRFEVGMSDGTRLEYEVVGLGQFEKSQLPFHEIFAKHGPPRLVLVTCGGDFNPTLRSYESNVVAFALPLV